MRTAGESGSRPEEAEARRAAEEAEVRRVAEEAEARRLVEENERIAAEEAEASKLPKRVARKYNNAKEVLQAGKIDPKKSLLDPISLPFGNLLAPQNS